MQCPHCGTRINPGYSTCTGCGAREVVVGGSDGGYLLVVVLVGWVVFGSLGGVYLSFTAELKGVTFGGRLILAAVPAVCAIFGMKVIKAAWSESRRRKDKTWIR